MSFLSHTLHSITIISADQFSRLSRAPAAESLRSLLDAVRASKTLEALKDRRRAVNHVVHLAAITYLGLGHGAEIGAAGCQVHGTNVKCREEGSGSTVKSRKSNALSAAAA